LAPAASSSADMSRAVSLWVVRLGRGTVRAEVAPARRSDDSRELQKNATSPFVFARSDVSAGAR
jgi:hypothetical protein